MVNSSIILLLVSAVFGAEAFGNPSENEIFLSGKSKGLIYSNDNELIPLVYLI